MGPGPASPAPPPAAFQERLWPAGWVWAAAFGLAVSAAVVADRFSGTAAVVAGAVTLALLAGGLVAGTPVVRVGGGELVAGRAHVPLELLGTVEVLDAAAMRHALGPGLDARAYLCQRGWVPGGVRVTLTDPQDPTPYWVVSSRNPQRLGSALVTEIEGRSSRRG